MRRCYGSSDALAVRDFSPFYGNFPDGSTGAAVYVGSMRTPDAL